MPLTTIVPAPEARDFGRIYWPQQYAQVGGSINYDLLGSTQELNAEDSGTTQFQPFTGSQGGTGVTADLRNPGGRLCGRIRCTGNIMGQAYFVIPFYYPILEPAGALDGENRPDPTCLVSTLDMWWRFESAPTSHAGGLTGFHIIAAEQSAAVDGNDLPGGGDPDTMFSISGVDDGAGTQTMALRTYNAGGGLLDQQLPASTPDPTAWNTASLTMVQNRPGVAAVLRDVEIGAQTVLARREFGTANLLSATDQVAGYVQPALIVNCEDNTSDDFYFRWQWSFGRFLPNGVEVRV